MGLFGRENEADRQRAERYKVFVESRSPFAIVSACLGLVAAVDAVTGVLGIAFGLAAIAVGWKGLADLRKRTHLLGRRLCYAGMTLGGVGILVGALLWATRWFSG